MIPSQQVYFLSGSVHPAEPVFCLLVERAVRPMSWAVRHLQIKWAKGSRKAGKRFMGGESFLGAGAGDGVGEGLGVGKRSREASEESACFGEPKAKAAAGVPGRGCSPQRRGACGEWRPPLCPSTPWRRGNVITGLIFRIAPQLPLDRAATPPRPRRNSPSTTPRSDLRRGALGGGGGGVLRPAFPWSVPSRDFPIMEVC